MTTTVLEPITSTPTTAPKTPGEWSGVKMLPVADLKPHPLSVRIYGAAHASDELLESIKSIGVLTAVIINESGFVISGTSRHAAARQLGLLEIPGVLFKGTPLDEELLVIEANRQRVKRPSVVGREFNERFRIEQELAAQRQKAGVPPIVAEGDVIKGDARDRAARAVNLGRTTAERLGKLVAYADKTKAGLNLLYELDKGSISITAAYDKVFGKKERKHGIPCDCTVKGCDGTFSSKTLLKKHQWRVHGLEPGGLATRQGYKNETPEPAISLSLMLRNMMKPEARGDNGLKSADVSKLYRDTLDELTGALKDNPMLSQEEKERLNLVVAALNQRIKEDKNFVNKFQKVLDVQAALTAVEPKATEPAPVAVEPTEPAETQPLARTYCQCSDKPTVTCADRRHYCAAKTKKGSQCSSEVDTAGDFCGTRGGKGWWGRSRKEGGNDLGRDSIPVF